MRMGCFNPGTNRTTVTQKETKMQIAEDKFMYFTQPG